VCSAVREILPCHLHFRLDVFTARLLGILRSSRNRRATLAVAGRPEVALGIHRSDYMLDAPSKGFLQVRTFAGRRYKGLEFTACSLNNFTQVWHGYMMIPF